MEEADATTLVTDYRPGAIGRIAEMHARYYSREWGFGLFFEARVATELAEFLQRHDSSRDLLMLALKDDHVVGSIVIDGSGHGDDTAHLRWFITDDACRGTGTGRALLACAMDFCRRSCFSSVYLWTFAGLDAAAHLYKDFGFRLTEEFAGNQWGPTVTEQRYEIDFTAAS